MTRRAAIYCRISDDREGRQLGVSRQEEDCRAFVEARGYALLKVYAENDISASTRSSKKRPLFEEMMELCENGTYQAIVAYSSARLTRRPLENERLIGLYEKHRVRIHYLNATDNDLSTARGRYNARNDAARDAEEAEEISERVTRASLQRAKQGHGHGGTRPYGWTATDRRELDPAELKELLAAARRVLAGGSLKSIAADLNARAVPTVTGAAWSSAALRGMLTNPRLVGIRMYKGEEIGRGDWKPALGEDMYYDLRSLLLDKSRRVATSNIRKYLLTGLALCGECTRPVVVKVQVRKGRPKQPRYWCAACDLYRTMEPVDRYVQEVIINVLEAGLTPAMPGPMRSQEKADRLRERIAETQRMFAEEDSLTPMQYQDTMRTLNRRLAEEDAAVIKDSRPLLAANVIGAAARQAWVGLELNAKRQIISELTEVRIHRAIRGKRAFDPDTVELIPKH